MVRRAKLEDALNIFLLDTQIFDESLGPNFINNDIRENKMAKYFVYEIGDKLIGYISAWVSDNTTILSFGVLEEYRRRGVGQMLFDALEPEIVGDLSLEVRVSNLNAIRFYEKNGLKKVAVRKDYYADHEDALLMVRSM